MCESAEDMDAEQQATAHCTAGQQSGEGACLLAYGKVRLSGCGSAQCSFSPAL